MNALNRGQFLKSGAPLCAARMLSAAAPEIQVRAFNLSGGPAGQACWTPCSSRTRRVGRSSSRRRARRPAVEDARVPYEAVGLQVQFCTICYSQPEIEVTLSGRPFRTA